jgi:putative thioredoxin
LLDRLVAEAGGRFFLGKIDVDNNPELAQSFQVQSIPMVLALRDGKLVDGFTGLRDVAELRAFVERLIGGPLDGGAGGDGGAEARERAAELEQAGDPAGAAELLARHLAAHEADGATRLALARVFADLGRAEDATATLDGLDEETRESAEVQALVRRLELLASGTDVDELARQVEAEPDELARRIELGRTLAAIGRTGEGLDQLLDAVERDRDFDDQAARKAMLEVFESLGEDNPLVGEYRRRLQMVLF